ncbi:Hydrophobic protein [Nymphaea thermarum]|nr:Hydrophobic protein [Nymphaea thermarum]
MGDGTANCVDILLAIILPPLGVFLKFGCKVNPPPRFSLVFSSVKKMKRAKEKDIEFWITLLLTIFGYLPGIIYAVYAITK